ncbi:MAG: hypothetical protein ACP5NP_15260 [Acetobacteraceae bacterium]
MLSLLAATSPAGAAAWLPGAGHGVVKPMLRLFDAQTAFPASGWSSDPVAGPTERETQLRVTGEAGLGHGFALEYDLRYGFLSKIRRKGKRDLASFAHGPRDQEIGLAHRLVATPRMAAAWVVNVEIPTGSAATVPALGTGRWAIEPDLELGRRWDGGRVGVSAKLGPRVFLDGYAEQLRATLGLDVALGRRVRISGEAFFSDTALNRHALPAAAGGELYDVLRLGGAVSYRLRHGVAPFLGYERYVAGRGIHAGERFVMGVEFRY